MKLFMLNSPKHAIVTAENERHLEKDISCFRAFICSISCTCVLAMSD